MKLKFLSLLTLLLLFYSCKKADPGIEPDPVKPEPVQEEVLIDTTMVTIAVGFEELLIIGKKIPDTKADGKVKYGDIKDIDSLNLGSSSYNHVKFTSIKGIRYFSNLRYLNMSASYVDSIDLEKNTKLEYLDCSGLSGPGGLLATVKYLNVGACPNLKYLDCQYNKLAALDVTKNTQLTTLNCMANSINKLDISHNPSLKSLNTSYNSGIENLDLSKAMGLTELRCADNTLAKLDVTMLADLQVLDCSYNFHEQKTTFTTLDLSNNPKLVFLDISASRLASIDLSKNPGLQELGCTSTKFETINLEGLKELKSFSCGYSQLLKINLSANAKLEKLFIGGSVLKEIDLHNNVVLKYLECFFQDSLTILDLRSNKKLEYVGASNCPNLKTICVSKLPDPSDNNWIVSPGTQFLICN